MSLSKIKNYLEKNFFPILIIFFGVFFLVLTINQYQETSRIVAEYKNAEQPTILTIVAALCIIFSGALYLFISSGYLSAIFISDQKKLLFNGFLMFLVFLVAYLNYSMIQNSVDEMAYKEKRKRLVTDRLLDLQLAQQFYKRENRQFATNFQDLISFLKNAQEKSVVKIELKELPKELDILTEKEQILQGYIRYDTAVVSILEKHYTSNQATRERITKKRSAFILDSLEYAPLSEVNGKASKFIFKYEISKDFITSKETVFFEILDPTPLLGTKPEVLKIGSLTENTANGNWTEK